ncbi:MAG: ATP-dependent Clp protease proteolytic subunit, partial [Alphaproteobacteria bacterium]|nr:ATP-dependent Clp protease proteolytic subunit [Alphaproteobacteria bacterium]
QNLDAVREALERDRFLTPEVAKEFGLIDDVVSERSTGAGE